MSDFGNVGVPFIGPLSPPTPMVGVAEDTPELRQQLRDEAHRLKDAGDDRKWRHIYAALLMERSLGIAEVLDMEANDDSLTMTVYKSGSKWGWRLTDAKGMVIARSESAKWGSALTATAAARVLFPEYEVQIA